MSAVGDGAVLDGEAFYGRLREFLAEQRPDLDGAIDPSLQLWEAGYLDSFGLIETISFLEELLDRPIEIGADDLPSFFTMQAMYLAFVAAGTEGGAQGVAGDGSVAGGGAQGGAAGT